MKTYYNKGIKIAQRVIDYVADNFYIDGVSEDNYYLHIDTFYNCREQGFKVEVIEEKNWNRYFTFWVYAQRNSDEPTITYTKDNRITNEMFDEEDWLERTKSFNNESKLENFILDLIAEKIEEGIKDEQ